MPAARRTESNAMLYTLITFVGIAIAAIAMAIVYYVKFEEQRTAAEQATRELEEIVDARERQNLVKIVGAKQPRKTYLGTMTVYFNEMVSKITGAPLEQVSAENLVARANTQFRQTLEILAKEQVNVEPIDPNTDGLVRIVEKVKNALVALQGEFEATKAVSFETEQRLLAEKAIYEQQIADIKKDYEGIENALRQSSGQRVQTIMDQFSEASAELERTKADMMKTDAELKIARGRYDYLQKQIWSLAAPPDSNVPAYKPDGKVMLVDNQIVHINIGTDDRVYRGLTLAIYDKGVPFPEDGKGKAEIEVFDVGKNVSQARVIRSERRRPIVAGDIVANLVWDSDRINTFVVVGDFDLNGDAQIEYDAFDRLKTLIEKWGGKVGDAISVDTDYLVMGKPPVVLKKPTVREMESDPMAMDKYEASLQKLNHYNEIIQRARELWIPVFNTERFLYFVGYKKLSARADSFY
ncbi:MAG: BRCT domain-containing protein [Planctomycetota bacterium]|jgi:hypothetical protein